ncbi:hypothetical protein PS664_02259 [Pseudomonas fluorescens]|nr:hypothetical protein PS664_02259 [Pseudomonas fluorescens]
MDIEFRGNGMRWNQYVGACDEYGVSGIASFEDLAEAHRRIAESHPGFKPLFSLDDLHQARSSSGHVRNNMGMDDASEEDIAALSPRDIGIEQHEIAETQHYAGS